MADRLLLYDGVCALCNRVVQAVLARDRARRYLFAPLQGVLGRKQLAAHGLDPDALDTFVLVLDPDTPQERVLTRGRAGVQVLREMGGIGTLVGVLGLLPTPVLNWGYNLIAKNRYKTFGQHESCPLPAPEHRERFL